MPFHRPISEEEQPGESNSRSNSRRSGALSSLVKAEQLMQIAFVLPCAMVLGWGAGWCFDHYLHTHWGVAAGLVLGIVAGMVSAIRMAVAAMNPPKDRGPK
jgi:F0F1-type ATP synthase assembly protein I